MDQSTVNSRRLMLRLLAGAGAGAAIAAPLRAVGLSVEAMNADTRDSLALACEVRDRHAELIAELQAMMDGRDPGSFDPDAVQTVTCPLCGCSLALAPRPDPGAAAF